MLRIKALLNDFIRRGITLLDDTLFYFFGSLWYYKCAKIFSTIQVRFSKLIRKNAKKHKLNVKKHLTKIFFNKLPVKTYKNSN